MKYHFKIRGGSATSERELELRTPPGARESGGRLAFTVEGEPAEADWTEVSPGAYSLLLGGRSFDVRVEAHRGDPAGGAAIFHARVGTRSYQLELRDPRRRRESRAAGAHEGPQEILAPMPGKIVKILVSESQAVNPGESLLVIEAMKMQNEIRAPRAGRVEKIFVTEGAGIEMGERLVRLG